MSVADTVRKIAEPIAEKLGVVLWDVEFKKEGSEYFLRVYIDRPEGVWISDCEEFSRTMDPILDELDPIEQSYNFQVCSAGLVRELKTTAHINTFLGKTASFCLYKPDEALGTKKFDAKLVSADDSSVKVEIDGTERTLDRKSVSRISIDLV